MPHSGLGPNYGLAQAAVVAAIVAAAPSGWNGRIAAPPAVVLAAAVHPAAAALLAAASLISASVWSPPPYFEAVSAGVLIGMVLSPHATVAATLWASLTAVLVNGAWYAGWSLWWAAPSAVLVAAGAAVATLKLRPRVTAKSHESPPAERRDINLALRLTQRRREATPDSLFL